MELSLFDLHCDTAYEMYAQSQPLGKNTLAVSLSQAACYRRYVQVMAHWTPPTLSDREGWEQLLAVHRTLRGDPSVTRKEAQIVRTLPCALNVPTLLLAIEDARVIDGRLDRISRLADMGFRFITPLWRGISSIGGAYDTDAGLTKLGNAAVHEMLRCGMIPDVSHASRRSAEEILAIAEAHARPVIASHSNAYARTPLPRNLTDAEIRAILRADGVIGINLCADFLRRSHVHEADVTDVVLHVEHFLSLGAKDALCLGCDLDGATVPPALRTLSRLPLIAEALLKQNYSESLVHAIFFGNAYRFAEKYLKK